MTPILAVFVSAVSLLVLLLSMPFDFTGRGEWGAVKSVEARLKWAGGLVALGITAHEGSVITKLSIGGLALWRGGRKKKSLTRSEKQKPAVRNNTFNLRKMIGLFSCGKLFKVGIIFLRRLVRALRLDVKLSGRYGAGEPELTGILAGIVALIDGRGITLDVQPDFTEEVLELSGTLRSRLIPAQLLGICLSFLWQKPVRTLWLSAIKNKIKFKKEAVQHA